MNLRNLFQPSKAVSGETPTFTPNFIHATLLAHVEAQLFGINGLILNGEPVSAARFKEWLRLSHGTRHMDVSVTQNMVESVADVCAAYYCQRAQGGVAKHTLAVDWSTSATQLMATFSRVTALLYAAVCTFTETEAKLVGPLPENVDASALLKIVTDVAAGLCMKMDDVNLAECIAVGNDPKFDCPRCAAKRLLSEKPFVSPRAETR